MKTTLAIFFTVARGFAGEPDLDPSHYSFVEPQSVIIAPPPHATMTLATTNVHLAWPASEATNLEGYTVYCGRSKGQYDQAVALMGDATNYTFEGLPTGDPVSFKGFTYYFDVKARSDDGSPESDLASATIYLKDLRTTVASNTTVSTLLTYQLQFPGSSTTLQSTTNLKRWTKANNATLQSIRSDNGVTNTIWRVVRTQWQPMEFFRSVN